MSRRLVLPFLLAAVALAIGVTGSPAAAEARAGGLPVGYDYDGTSSPRVVEEVNAVHEGALDAGSGAASEEARVLDNGRATVRAVECTYDHRLDFDRPPPAVAVSCVYDAPSNLVDPTGGPGRARRAISGLEVLTYTPRTAGGLADAASGARLNARLAADEIASGHAYTKHVVQRGEFPGIRTRTQFADMVENVINNYDDVRHLFGGRTAYWRDGVVVIRNPAAADGGSAFVPRDGYSYFLSDLN